MVRANHSLYVLVFLAALFLFLTQTGYGNSMFFGLRHDAAGLRMMDWTDTNNSAQLA